MLLHQAKELYKERSPITHVAGLSVPVVFFQGSEDKIVPPDQATAMYEVIKGKGLQVCVLCSGFPGESPHGLCMWGLRRRHWSCSKVRWLLYER